MQHPSASIFPALATDDSWDAIAGRDGVSISIQFFTSF